MTAPCADTFAVFSPGLRAPQLRALKVGVLRDDEVRVRIVATGVCHTDVAVREQLTTPTVLGHEGAGVVEAVGAAVTRVAAGDHVVLSYDSCGHCDSCEAHKPCYCRNFGGLNMTGRRLDGSSALTCEGDPVGGHFFGQSSFATVSTARERNVVKVRRDAPLEILGPLGCGLQTGAGTVLNVLKPDPGSSIVVVGGGGVGLSAVMAAKVAGCDPIILIEPNAARRSLALTLGAHAALDPMEDDVVEAIKAIAQNGAAALIDTSGRGGVIAGFLEALAPRAVVVVLAANPTDPALSLPLRVMIGKGLTVKGVVEGESQSDVFIPQLIDLFLDGRFPIDRLITFYDFADLDRAIADQEQGLAVKPVVRMKP